MTTTIKAKKSAAQYVVEILQGRRSLTFQDRKLRDLVASDLKAHGVQVRLSSMRNQLMHPEHVDDYEGEVETGFDNTMYRTHFKAIYMVARQD